MGIYGEWFRVSPAELERAKADPDWAHDLANNTADAEMNAKLAVGERRSFGTDKTWQVLDYLLCRHGFPVSIVYGEEHLVDDSEDSEVTWGFVRPAYLTPAQVRQASAALAGLTEQALLGGVDIADLVRDEIYPSGWESPLELPWAVCHLPDVKTYFEAAAKQGDAILCWIR